MKRAAIERLLPAVYQVTADEGPLSALLDAMEALHEPDEQVLSDIHDYFDPYLAPAPFVPYLATWVDLEWVIGELPEGAETVFPPGVGRLRNLVAIAGELSGRRGTADVLRYFLETATGVRGFVVEDAHEDDPPYHVRVHAPEAAGAWRAIVERIVEWERPAHATVTLTFEGDARTADASEPTEPSESPEPPEEPAGEEREAR